MNSENGYNLLLRSNEDCMAPSFTVAEERKKKLKCWKLGIRHRKPKFFWPFSFMSCIQSSGECLLFSNLHLHLKSSSLSSVPSKSWMQDKNWGASTFRFRNTNDEMNNKLDQIIISLADSQKWSNWAEIVGQEIPSDLNPIDEKYGQPSVLLPVWQQNCQYT